MVCENEVNHLNMLAICQIVCFVFFAGVMCLKDTKLLTLAIQLLLIFSSMVLVFLYISIVE